MLEGFFKEILVFGRFLSSLSGNEIFWSALSAIGTIGAVIFSLAAVYYSDKYKIKYKLKILIKSEMGFFDFKDFQISSNNHTELTQLSFKIINKSDRVFENYSVSLDTKPTIFNKIFSYSQTNMNFPIGDYEKVKDPRLQEYSQKPIEPFKNSSIKPFKPQEVYFDLREEFNENDNIGWSIKSMVDQGYFSGHIRICVIDEIGNCYYSRWHKLNKPRRKDFKRFINKNKFLDTTIVKRIHSKFIGMASKKHSELTYEYVKKRTERYTDSDKEV